MTESMPTGFGQPNPSCTACGDERGGPSGHTAATCQWWPGMSVDLLVRLPHLADRRPEVWEHYVDRYLDHELARVEARQPTVTVELPEEAQ